MYRTSLQKIDKNVHHTVPVPVLACLMVSSVADPIQQGSDPDSTSQGKLNPVSHEGKGNFLNPTKNVFSQFNNYLYRYLVLS
jgi:hypothetical protein